MRSGTVVGSFKIDVKTLYDAPGISEYLSSFYVLKIQLFFYLLLAPCCIASHARLTPPHFLHNYTYI